VFVDAELDWREWTDQQDKREAVTFKARQVLFEGTRPSPEAAVDPPAGAAQAAAAPTAQASPTDAVTVAATSGNGAAATVDDLPF
jgi:single-stranded DNA-binding protein